MAFVLLTLLYSEEIIDIKLRETPLIATFSDEARPVPGAAGQLPSPSSPGPAHAQSAAAEGQKLAFDRGKGNCLTCHDIKGGDLPGTIGPELTDIKSKYPNRDDLVAILTDETKRNPQTVMPPFGRNRILTEQGDQRDRGFPADPVTRKTRASGDFDEP